MSLFTVTVNNISPAMDRRDQELQRIQRALDLAANAARVAGGTVTSGNINDAQAGLVGSWTYTPQASS